MRSQENTSSKMRWFHWYLVFQVLSLELSQVRRLTETVFAFPGMGKMLIDSIKASNNTMVIGLVFIFTSLGIFAAMLGDILMTVLDPRIKLTNTKGGK